MGKFALSKRKLDLNELCEGHLNLLKPHRKLLAEYKNIRYLDYKKHMLKH